MGDDRREGGRGARGIAGLRMEICDGCGEPTAVEALAICERYGACKSCVKKMSARSAADRRDELSDPLAAASNAQARALVETAEGRYTLTARAVLRYRGLDQADGERLVRG